MGFWIRCFDPCYFWRVARFGLSKRRIFPSGFFPAFKNSQSFAYVFELLTVLTVLYLPDETPHIMSFRPAHRSEREVYHDWLENDYPDS